MTKLFKSIISHCYNILKWVVDNRNRLWDKSLKEQALSNLAKQAFKNPHVRLYRDAWQF